MMTQTAAVSSEWTDVGAVTDVPHLGSRVVATSTGDVAVFRSGTGEVFALRDKCPHKGGPLSQGIVHGKRVTCPLHGWVVELETGEAVAPDHGCAHVVPCRVDGQRILLKLTTAHR